MAANIGEMFYVGGIPWHGEGIQLAKPATVEEALKVGGLNKPGKRYKRYWIDIKSEYEIGKN